MTVSDMQKPTARVGLAEDFTNAADGKLNTKSHACNASENWTLARGYCRDYWPDDATLQAAVADGSYPERCWPDLRPPHGAGVLALYFPGQREELQRLREGDLPDSPASSSTGGRQ